MRANVLNELRQALRIKRGNWLSTEPLGAYAQDRARGLTDAIASLDAFEARHPNLTECGITSCAAHKEVTP